MKEYKVGLFQKLDLSIGLKVDKGLKNCQFLQDYIGPISDPIWMHHTEEEWRVVLAKFNLIAFLTDSLQYCSSFIVFSSGPFTRQQRNI